MLVPSPAFRSMALGIMLSVVFVLAATLTLLPAVLAKLGPRVDKLSLPWVHSGEHRSPRFAALGRAPVAAAARLRRRRARRPASRSRVPVLGLETGMPSIKVVPERRRLARRATTQVQARVRRRARPARCRSSRRRPTRERAAAIAQARPGRRPGHAAAARRAAAARWSRPSPTQDPSDQAVGATIDRLRARRCRRARSSAARSPRTTTSSRRWPRRRRSSSASCSRSASCCCWSRCRRR